MSMAQVIKSKPTGTGRFEPNLAFEALPMGRRLYIHVAMPYGPNASLGGFNTEAQARDWISRDSAKWAKDQVTAHLRQPSK